MNDLQKELYNSLYKKYGKALLSKKETAEIIGVSIPTLDRMRVDGIGMDYKKMPSRSNNGTVKYPLHEVARYLTEQNIKTA